MTGQNHMPSASAASSSLCALDFSSPLPESRLVAFWKEIFPCRSIRTSMGINSSLVGSGEPTLAPNFSLTVLHGVEHES